MFENKDSKRFEFSIVVTPKSCGNFGSVRISGLYYSPDDCINLSSKMVEEIERHIDGVDSCHVVISDALKEFEDFDPWQYKSIVSKKAKNLNIQPRNVRFEDVRNELPSVLYIKEDLLSNYNWVRKSLLEGNLSIEEIVAQMDIDVPRDAK